MRGRADISNSIPRFPRLFLFDYGQTLMYENQFDALAAYKAILECAVCNPENVSARDLADFSSALLEECCGPARENRLEIHNYQFQNYIYEYFGLKFDCDAQTLDSLFWETAAPGFPTEGIQEFLDYLYEHGVVTGVVSNLNFSGRTLADRINKGIPHHHFQFILASSEYVFRKPSPRIYQMAMKKAGISPENTWFVGDNPLCDVDGPARLGVASVWYQGAPGDTDAYADVKFYTPEFPHFRVSNWKELREMLCCIQEGKELPCFA